MLLLQEEDVVLHQEEEEICFRGDAKRSDKRGSFGDRGKGKSFSKDSGFKSPKKNSKRRY